MRLLISLILIGYILALTTGCGGQQRPTMPAAPTLHERIMEANVPDFDEDSAYHFVDRQVSFGPRVPNTLTHTACANYLEATLGRFTPRMVVQDARVRAFNGTVLNIKNIIGSFNPENKSRILLCAHWDSRPFADHDPDPANHYKPLPGANDGASGVGVLLEVARQLSIQQPSMGIDIIFFDAEDYGEHQQVQGQKDDTWALGSQYWARNPHLPGYRARFGILLDMVGAADAMFTMEGTSMQYAPDVMKKVWDISEAIGFGTYFSRKRTNAIIDDHLYINQIIHIPTIDIIHHSTNTHTGFFEHWHTMLDNMNAIDPSTLKVVGQTVLTVIYLEN
ncbi:MAG: M28 family peptidase [Bacteroidales bacterium]|nr:M28 family peptidase [Bacteroidales bacterium]MDZ4203599.1 M28 family peptidase [Bacteroidales bacterium]